ncbi:uncharacterized protein LOC102801174 [Saccoglossus kowalevskii]|uniref:Uncharacterized protein LOC102801174 n=1 Tax=Saccoglossus kowalevskii TaxID=10224 RepID=A0ABM0MJG2_SACKO|nr:PREDICTED: uncharacterized protein LOC102801174 [Saccoglossus kowalevskii]
MSMQYPKTNPFAPVKTKILEPNNVNIVESTVNKLKIYYTNADSLLNKLDELCVVIGESDPDIVIITEMFPKNFNADEIDMSEYTLPGYDCWCGTIKKHSRGVGIYAKHGLPITPCSEINEHCFKEHVWCKVQLNNGSNLLLGAIYRSPNSDDDNTELLFDLLNNCCLTSNSICIVGDFNFPTICWDSWTTSRSENHISFQFIECVRDNYLQQLLSKPTRYRDGQTPRLLDLLFIDNEHNAENIIYGNPIGLSDHVSIMFELKYSYFMNKNNAVHYNFYRGRYNEARVILVSVDWSILETLDINNGWNMFDEKMKNCIQLVIPIAKSIGRKKPLWMDNKALRAVKKKYKSWKRYTYTRSYNDYATYCGDRNKASRATRFAKTRYEQGLVDCIGKNPKAFCG